MKTYTVVLSPEPDTDWYSVSVPALPGALSQGLGRPEALRNIQEAMEGWLEGGEAVPEIETPELIAEAIQFVLTWKAEEGWPLVVETVQVSVPFAFAA